MWKNTAKLDENLRKKLSTKEISRNFNLHICWKESIKTKIFIHLLNPDSISGSVYDLICIDQSDP